MCLTFLSDDNKWLIGILINFILGLLTLIIAYKVYKRFAYNHLLQRQIDHLSGLIELISKNKIDLFIYAFIDGKFTGYAFHYRYDLFSIVRILNNVDKKAVICLKSEEILKEFYHSLLSYADSI